MPARLLACASGFPNAVRTHAASTALAYGLRRDQEDGFTARLRRGDSGDIRALPLVPWHPIPRAPGLHHLRGGAEVALHIERESAGSHASRRLLHHHAVHPEIAIAGANDLRHENADRRRISHPPALASHRNRAQTTCRHLLIHGRQGDGAAFKVAHRSRTLARRRALQIHLRANHRLHRRRLGNLSISFVVHKWMVSVLGWLPK
jgi:hypothetical protein